jgi:hypothetical protein
MEQTHPVPSPLLGVHFPQRLPLRLLDIASTPFYARLDVNIYGQRDGDTDLKFLSRDTHLPYVDNRSLLVAGKPEMCQHKAVFVVGDQDVRECSDDITVNCAPLV